MANKRIKDLTDTQATYSPDIYLAVDDATFTNTKKMAVDSVYPKTNTLSATGDFNPTTQLFRMDNGSGSESKLTVANMFADTDVIAIIKLLGNTGWKVYPGDITLNSAKVVAGTFVCSAISTLGIVTMTGKFDTTSQPTTDETLWTLPSTMPLANKDIYFGAVDSQASGGEDENYELYIPSGTRTVKNHIAGSSGNEAVFCVTYIAI